MTRLKIWAATALLILGVTFVATGAEPGGSPWWVVAGGLCLLFVLPLTADYVVDVVHERFTVARYRHGGRSYGRR